MKTKFSKILKLRNDELKKIEREVLSINALIAAKKGEIENLNSSMNDFCAPKETKKYANFLAFREMLSGLRVKIKEEEIFLEMLESRKIDTLKKYNRAKMEYEKINYLHLGEVKIIKESIKHKEQSELDEIAGRKYAQ